MRTAKRLAAIVGMFVLTGIPAAASALAGPYPPPKQPPEGVLPTVAFPPEPVSAGGTATTSEGTLAFTGAELTLLFGVLAVLVVTGAFALLAARRRTARAAA